MKITKVSAKPLSGTIRKDIAIVSSLGAHIVGQYVLVAIQADNGLVGYGEATVTAVWERGKHRWARSP